MLNIIYAGTPEFALPALDALRLSDHRVIAVYTQPDRPAGRGRQLQPSPVKEFALQQDWPVYQPPDFKATDTVDELRALNADVMVVAAYGLLLPQAVLDAPRHGCLNIHASLLPRWRGASPIQQAILAGDEVSGVTLMKMAAGLDTGDMISCSEIEIDPGWSAADLHDRLATLGAGLLLDALTDLPEALSRARPQDDAAATYAPRLRKQEAAIDWSQPADRILREIRAYNPWPVSFTHLDGNNVRLWRAVAAPHLQPGAPGEVVDHDAGGVCVSCADGVIAVTELQLAGRRAGSAAELLNARNLTGCRLGQD